MDKVDELLTLMDLEKVLKPIKFDRLNIHSLHQLRADVKRKLNQLNNRDENKIEPQIKKNKKFNDLLNKAILLTKKAQKNV